jgi:hypothetical protein
MNNPASILCPVCRTSIANLPIKVAGASVYGNRLLSFQGDFRLLTIIADNVSPKYIHFLQGMLLYRLYTTEINHSKYNKSTLPQIHSVRWIILNVPADCENRAALPSGCNSADLTTPSQESPYTQPGTAPGFISFSIFFSLS